MKKVLFASLFIFTLLMTSCVSHISSPDGETAIIHSTQTGDITITPTLIYNNAGVSVTAKSLDFSNTDFATLNFEITNTNELDVAVSTNYLKVNSLTVAEEAFNVICPSGETILAGADITSDILEISDIDIIKNITLSLKTYTVREFMSEGGPLVERKAIDKKTEDIVLKTNAPKGYKQSIDNTGVTLLNADGVKVILNSVINLNGTPAIKAYCINEFTKTLRINITFAETNFVGTLSMPAACEGFAYFTLDDETSKLEQATITTEAVYGSKIVPTIHAENTTPATVKLK